MRRGNQPPKWLPAPKAPGSTLGRGPFCVRLNQPVNGSLDGRPWQPPPGGCGRHDEGNHSASQLWLPARWPPVPCCEAGGFSVLGRPSRAPSGSDSRKALRAEALHRGVAGRTDLSGGLRPTASTIRRYELPTPPSDAWDVPKGTFRPNHRTGSSPIAFLSVLPIARLPGGSVQNRTHTL
jgi:hypothetical protein